MKEIRFGRIVIGEDAPAVIIAEAACEHQGKLEEAIRIVDLAKEAGADIIKFQLHIPSEEMVPGSIRFWAGSMDDILDRVNLPVAAHEVLMKHCREVGIQYLCTPFCAGASDILDDLGIDAFKIGSGEMSNFPMLRHIAGKKKPMILSTGMATSEEVEDVVRLMREEGAEFMLMNCTSAYPPKYDEINLRLIPRYKEKFDVVVGHSDHTPDLWTALGAVALGAKVIEKHFTPDRSLKGPDHHVSLEPREFRTLVDAIRKLESALGSEKKIHADEESVRQWAHHSVVCLRDLRKGTVLSAGMVGVKRPGWGIPARYMDQIYSRVLNKDMAQNSILKWEDLADP